MLIRKNFGLPVGLMMTVLAGLLASVPALSNANGYELYIDIFSVDQGQYPVYSLDPFDILAKPTDLEDPVGTTATFLNLTGQTFRDFHFEFPTIDWEVYLDGGSFFDVFVEVDIDGNTSGANFDAKSSPGIKPNDSYGFTITHNYVTDEPAVKFTYYPTVGVPEPATLALLSLGLVGLGFTRRRMKA